MPTGQLSHVDISVGYPGRSIPFYDAFFTALGYRRWRSDSADWCEPDPRRAAWGIRYADGSAFGVEVRPAHDDRRDRRYDRYEPGPHHFAFHAGDRRVVDDVHNAMVALNADVLDAPAEYGGRPGYGDEYYAVFIADPDNLKLEVCYVPG